MPTSRPTAQQLLDLLESFDWDEWNKQLAPDLEQVYRDLVISSGKRSGGGLFDQDDPFLQKHMTEYLGSRIAQLAATSKTEVREVLRKALEGGEDLTPAKLQGKILGAVRKKYEAYETYRALRIARSESAIAFNHGNVFGGIQAGFTHFEVVDGTDDPECAEANGAVWTAQQCLENPIQHPNCSRSFFGVEAPAEG